MILKRPTLVVSLSLVAGLLLATAWLGRSLLWRLAFGGSDPSEVNVPVEGSEPIGPLVTPRVDFSGRWELDLKASDSLDEILKACGVSLAERWILDKAPILQDVKQTPSEVTIDITSGPYHRNDVMLLNGQRVNAEDPAGRPVESSTVWNEDGTALITSIWARSDQPPWVMTRTLSDDGNTTIVLNEVSTPEGRPIACKRIYRRIGEANSAAQADYRDAVQPAH
jgi:hypothetical protein